ncbi:hypothetical protein FRC11_013572 [Ceratobasidium sp. 423]|nr:hypothetical protein FRC11_013572 [Ceratobasidium sp. 423]
MFQCLVKHGCDDLSHLIDSSKYSSCRVAEGAFGDIWKGQLCNGTPVAVKVLRFGLMAAGGGKNLKRMMRKIYAWAKLDHENVHRLLGVMMIKDWLGMVSRWMTQGNLRDYLDHNKNLGRHEMSNILVSSDGVLKFTDFDHSLIADCSLRFTDTTRMGGGTPRWMAPELFAETSHQRSKKTDIYALGMTFLEVITGAPPYFPQCNNDIQVMFKVVQRIIPDRSLEYFPENRRGNEMWKLLTRCWEYDPVSRPPAQEVLKSIPSPSLL